MTKTNPDVLFNQEKDDNPYGFNAEDVSIYKTPKGLNEDIIREISSLKREPMDVGISFEIFKTFLRTSNAKLGC